jgi:urocanate hydratase
MQRQANRLMERVARSTENTQFSVSASAGQRGGDVEIRDYLRDQVSQAGSWSLVFDLGVTHERLGGVLFTPCKWAIDNKRHHHHHPQDIVLLRKSNSHRQQYTRIALSLSTIR